MMMLNDFMRCALGFVLEDESWPVFHAWLKQQPHSTTLGNELEATDSKTLLHRLRMQYVKSSTLTLRD